MTQSLQITPQVLAATCRRNGYRSVDIAAELGISVERCAGSSSSHICRAGPPADQAVCDRGGGSHDVRQGRQTLWVSDFLTLT